MSEASRSCPSCGARIPAGADQCRLCGTPVADASRPAPDEGASGAGEEASSVPEEGTGGEGPSSARASEDEGSGVFCNQCGLENPVDANYCSRCGRALQDLSGGRGSTEGRPVAAELPRGSGSSVDSETGAGGSETDREPDDEQAAMGTQILWTVGISLVIVLGFFFATQWSEQREWGDGGEDRSSSAMTESGGSEGTGATDPSSGPGERGAGGASPQPAETDLQSLVSELSPSVDGPVAETIDSLRAVEESAEGTERREVRRELVQMYVGAGAPGRAALLQSEVADETGAVDDRRRAADLLYRWMRQVEQQQGRAEVTEVARHVATAYASVVEGRGDDLDARTRMGEAYLLTNNPMKGIEAINGVLEEDSTFVPARFQKGLALLQINRLDQALEQFERVQTHADEGDPFYRQAERAIEVIRKQTSSAGGGDGDGA